MEVDPADLARAEQNEYPVESILDHRHDHNAKKRTSYEFLVKWTGCDNSDNTWEPWEFVRDNREFIKYLYTHRLRQFLTKSQKDEAKLLTAEANNN